MEIHTCERLISTGYRFLLETVQNKGLGPVLNLVQDIKKLPSKNILIQQTILGEENALNNLNKNHEAILEHFREHKDELSINFLSENVLNTLTNLENNDNLLEVYLKNARKLEELKVSNIEFCSRFELYDTCKIYRNYDGQIISIDKKYTDGQIPTVWDETLENIMTDYIYSRISYRIDDIDMSFYFHVQNNEQGYSYRGITIKDFGFDASKLPTEEEIRSYEIPKQLVKK